MKEKTTASADFTADWLLLVLSVPGPQSALRMRIWRALKALGTAVLRDGVYLLPDREEFRAAFEAQSREIVAAGGTVQVLVTKAQDEHRVAEFMRLFDRSAEYDALLTQIRKMRAGVRKRKDAKSIETELTRLRREFEAIAAIDFFPGRTHEQAQHALSDLIAVSDSILSPGEPHAADVPIPRLRVEEFRGRTWATRKRPWADRLASAWFILRFIDPKAHIVWLDKPRDCPRDALGFDFDGASFTHVDDKVTVEVLIASFGLDDDPALIKVGSLVHYLDVGGAPVTDAAGFEALLRGARDSIADDDRLLSESNRLFDLLYVGYK